MSYSDDKKEEDSVFISASIRILPLRKSARIGRTYCSKLDIILDLKHLPCNNILGQFPCLLQRLCLLACACFFNCCLTGLFEFFFKMSVYLFRDKGMSHESRNNFLPTEVSFGAAVSFVLVFYFRLYS